MRHLIPFAMLCAAALPPSAVAAPFQFPANTSSIALTDNAQVTFGNFVGPGQLSFVDVGSMPVTGYTAGGITFSLEPGVEAVIRYSAAGIQNISPFGVPTNAVYTELEYTLETSTSGGLSVLGSGRLISGQIAFQPDGSIAGEVNVTAAITGISATGLDISIYHAPDELTFISGNAFTLQRGSIVAVLVPEPGSLLLLLPGLALLGAGAVRWRDPRHGAAT